MVSKSATTQGITRVYQRPLLQGSENKWRPSTLNAPSTASQRRCRLRTPAMPSSRTVSRHLRRSGSALPVAAVLRNTRTKKATASHTSRGANHPLLLPSTGDARPFWTLDNLKRATSQAKNGRVAILQFHGAPDLEHPWVHT